VPAGSALQQAELGVDEGELPPISDVVGLRGDEPVEDLSGLADEGGDLGPAADLRQAPHDVVAVPHQLQPDAVVGPAVCDEALVEPVGLAKLGEPLVDPPLVAERAAVVLVAVGQADAVGRDVRVVGDEPPPDRQGLPAIVQRLVDPAGNPQAGPQVS
jgi:hypothetical protein